MRLVIQRVSHASVAVDGNIVGEIDKGLLVLVGVTHSDTIREIKWLANKLINLRIFNDDNGKMNLSLKDIQGKVLAVSQFTLYGDAVKGNRPSFIDAAKPELANELYELFKDEVNKLGIQLSSGVFGADMQVNLLNDGPVTIILER